MHHSSRDVLGQVFAAIVLEHHGLMITKDVDFSALSQGRDTGIRIRSVSNRISEAKNSGDA
jgi:hypothetical protein